MSETSERPEHLLRALCDGLYVRVDAVLAIFDQDREPPDPEDIQAILRDLTPFLDARRAEIGVSLRMLMLEESGVSHQAETMVLARSDDLTAPALPPDPAFPPADAGSDTVVVPDTTPTSSRSSLVRERLENLQEALQRASSELAAALDGGLDDLPALASTLSNRVLDPVVQLCPDVVVGRLKDALVQHTDYDDVRLINNGGMGWVFTGVTPGGERRAIKVPRSFVAPEILAIHERETDFLRTLEENGLNTGDWFVRFFEDGLVPVGSRHFPYTVLSYVTGPRRTMTLLGEEVETDQALTLGDIIPLTAAAPPELTGGLVRDLLDGLVELHELGVLHGDLKPGNVLIAPETAAVIPWPLSPKAIAEDLDLAAIAAAIARCRRRIVTADFGGVREMESFLLGDEVVDARTGEAIVVQTTAYSNMTGLLRHGKKAHSDRHAVACILFELLTGRTARSSRMGGRYVTPAGQAPDRAEFLELAVEILNDPDEDTPHTDPEVEVAHVPAVVRRGRLPSGGPYKTHRKRV